jgi:hypothetical protein
MGSSKDSLNEAFTMIVKDLLVTGAPCPTMFDVMFWWCAFVALAGSYVLVGIVLITGSRPKSHRLEAQLSTEPTLMMRHFGRA